MEDTKYVISRPINGITINGREYALDGDDNILKFDTEADARKFLKDNGNGIDDDPDFYGVDIMEYDPEMDSED